jgi:hypothetical protein
MRSREIPGGLTDWWGPRGVDSVGSIIIPVINKDDVYKSYIFT